MKSHPKTPLKKQTPSRIFGRTGMILALIASIALLSPDLGRAEETTVSKSTTATELSVVAGSMIMGLGPLGDVTSIRSASKDTEYLDPAEKSYLLLVKKHGTKELSAPIAMRREKAGVPPEIERLILSYPGDISATVEIALREDYIRMKLVRIKPVEEVEQISWGPLRTTMQEPIAEYLGLVRSPEFTIGMLSLEPNTDGAEDRAHYHVAHYLEGGGSYLEALSSDHTRDGMGHDQTRITGIPGVTVEGSAVALFGCAREQELEVVEKVELGEKLAHPMLDGVWMKRSPKAISPSLWIHFGERNIGDCIPLAQKMGAKTICSFIEMFGNWGHFQPDLRAYPGGEAGLAKAMAEAKAGDIDIVMYTLTTFLKPRTRPEPFVSPVPHRGLQIQGLPTKLVSSMDRESKRIVLEDRDGLVDALKMTRQFGSWTGNAPAQVIRVNDEIVAYGSVALEDGRIVLDGCLRGQYSTKAAEHGPGAEVVRLYIAGYRNFYPGTIGLQDEMAANIARVAHDGGFGQVTLDGYESCLETGHGAYAKNRLLKLIYDRCSDRPMRFSASNFGNYDWHMVSYMSWGEFDKEQGFRGTMLDYRLRRQIQLKRNHMPHKMGQHYPDNASLEDIEWLMARAAGWDAGVEFHVDLGRMNRNPQLAAIGAAIKLWTAAREENAFTEAQKMQLRQTDRLYTLSRRDDGTIDLKFLGRWQKPGVPVLPHKDIDLKPVNGGSESLVPCGIDFSWTHNPGIFKELGLGDDMIHRSGNLPTEWTASYEGTPNEHGEVALQFVLRLPEDAPCAVRNPCVTVDGDRQVLIPVTLQPGQYLSTVHNTPWVSIYDREHNVIGEAYVRQQAQELPMLERDRTYSIALSAEPLKADAKPELRMNLRTHAYLSKQR